MTAPRFALLGAIAATLLLAGCSAPAPSPAGDGPTPVESEPTIVTLSDLEFSYDTPETIADLADARSALEQQFSDYTSTCTAEQAGSADSPDCTEGVLTTLKNVNAIKTIFDFSPWTDADFKSDDFSGLEALEPTKVAIQAASDNGSDVVDGCYYVPGGDGCADQIEGFFVTVDAAIAEMQTWAP